MIKANMLNIIFFVVLEYISQLFAAFLSMFQISKQHLMNIWIWEYELISSSTMLIVPY